jgi:ABC-2 type transport system permease protein
MPEQSPTAAVRRAPASMHLPIFSDARTMCVRALRLSLRNVESLITALALPVMLMLMFVYLFGGAIHTGTHYVDYVVPGVLLLCVAFGAGTTAVSVAHDLNGAVIDRFRSMDVRGEALINGHVLASVLRNLFSTALVFVVAFAIGFRSHASFSHWIAAIGILTLFILALSWFAAAIGIAARSPEASQGITFLISFLAYPSSAIVPVDTMPTWLRGFAENQPFTQVIDATRAFLNGTPVGLSAWHAILWSLAIIAVSVALAGVLFARRTG